MWRILSTYPQYLLVNPDDLSLFWRTFASHQVADFETQKVGRRRPESISWKIVLLEELFADFHQSMNQSVQVSNKINMKILDNLWAEFSTNFLNLVNKISSVFTFNLHIYDFWLHFIIVLPQVFHKLNNFFLLLLKSLVYPLSHPTQKGISISSLQIFHTLRPICKVANLIILLPKLFTPFC